MFSINKINLKKIVSSVLLSLFLMIALNALLLLCGASLIYYEKINYNYINEVNLIAFTVTSVVSASVFCIVLKKPFLAAICNICTVHILLFFTSLILCQKFIAFQKFLPLSLCTVISSLMISVIISIPKKRKRRAV